MSDPKTDPLVEAVRLAVERTSAQTVALRASVSDETVYALLRGGRVGKGSRRLLEEAAAFLTEVRSEFPVEAQPDDITALVASLPPGVKQADGSILFPPETYGFLLGRLVTITDLASGMEDQVGAATKTAHAMGETLQSLRNTVARVTNGVAGVARTVLGDSRSGPNLDVVLRGARAIAEAEARAAAATPPGDASAPPAVAAMGEAAPAPATSSAPHRRRRAG